jgi:hypothetical protein
MRRRDETAALHLAEIIVMAGCATGIAWGTGGANALKKAGRDNRSRTLVRN